MRRQKILVVDDHPLVRQGLASLVESRGDLEICAHAFDLETALSAVEQLHPDLVITDLSLRGIEDGLELIQELSRRGLSVPVLVLTMHEEPYFAERALCAGARGYLTKKEAGEQVLVAIDRVLAGELFLCDALSPRLLQRVAARRPPGEGDLLDVLTERERQVFIGIGEGRTSREIAERLGLSVKTVETYRTHIKDKLDLESARELVRYATRWVMTHRPDAGQS